MAVIKMDVTEYQEMQKNALLLEQSLRREQELSAQISKLNEEKIKALEDAKMKVVKIIKKQTHQNKMVKRDGLCNLIRYIRFGSTSENQHGTTWMEMVTQNRDEYDYSYLNDLIDSTFETVTSFSEDVVSTTVHGMDEIKVEIRKELESQIIQETKDKLKRGEEANKQLQEFFDENNLLRKSLIGKDKVIDGMDVLYQEIIKENIELQKELKACTSLSSLVDEIEKTLLNQTILTSHSQKWKILGKIKKFKEGLTEQP